MPPPNGLFSAIDAAFDTDLRSVQPAGPRQEPLCRRGGQGPLMEEGGNGKRRRSGIASSVRGAGHVPHPLAAPAPRPPAFRLASDSYTRTGSRSFSRCRPIDLGIAPHCSIRPSRPGLDPKPLIVKIAQFAVLPVLILYRIRIARPIRYWLIKETSRLSPIALGRLSGIGLAESLLASVFQPENSTSGRKSVCKEAPKSCRRTIRREHPKGNGLRDRRG